MPKTHRAFSLVRVGILFAIGYCALLLFTFFVADRLIFLPHRSSYRDGPDILKLTAGDGEKIAAIHLPNPHARLTMLYSHGNGEDLGDDLPLLRQYQRRGFAVFAYDYHGYGLSSGHPSERAAYDDEETAYNYLTTTLKVQPKQVIAYGRSLGAGVAVDLAAQKSLAGLVIESSFVSAFRVRTGWKVSPFDKFRSLDKIGAVRCPVLVIHGTDDGVIRVWHGRELFARAKEPKFSLWVNGAGHNDLIEKAGEEYWSTLTSFANLL